MSVFRMTKVQPYLPSYSFVHDGHAKACVLLVACLSGTHLQMQTKKASPQCLLGTCCISKSGHSRRCERSPDECRPATGYMPASVQSVLVMHLLSCQHKLHWQELLQGQANPKGQIAAEPF
jgi:hypothetical protein